MRPVVSVLCVSIACCLLSAVCASTNDVVVDAPFGTIKGMRKTDEATGQSHVVFMGIPFAKPPVGELRFAKPVPHPKIDGVFDATRDDDPMCPHPDLMRFGFTSFTEDCLVLNIHMKDGAQSSQENDLKKVLVYIHGGGYVVGAGSFYKPTSFIIGQDVIVVTINYRLGLLAFLSTEDEASPGNYALWDQSLAINWVKDNIRAFGGDPNDIAIAGESAGGSSVGYQILSPYSKGLFTKAYPQSGTGTSAFGRETKARFHAQTFAKTVGCWDKEENTASSLEENTKMIDCLRNTPLSNFTSYFLFAMEEPTFAPRVDGDFIPDVPIKLLHDDAYLDSIDFFSRSYIVGVDDNEKGLIDNYMNNMKKMMDQNEQMSADDKQLQNERFLKVATDNYLIARLGEDGAKDEKVVAEIKDFYERRYMNDSVFTAMCSDLNFLIPSIDYLLACSRRESCSSYFMYVDHFPKFMTGSYRGSLHGVDILYWWDATVDDLELILQVGAKGDFTEEDEALKKLMQSMLGQFIKTGNPNSDELKLALQGEWPTYDKTYAMNLNFNPRPWIGRLLEKDKYDLWLERVPAFRDTEEEHTHSEL